jgi:hypothetical protein
MQGRARPQSSNINPDGSICGDKIREFGEQSGMTLLEHYAGLAMKSLIIANYTLMLAGSPAEIVIPEYIANESVVQAKALIKRLEKENGG